MKTPELHERLIAFEDAQSMEFAIKADFKSVVLFDKYGYFMLVDTGPGELPNGERTENKIVLQDAEGNRQHVYYEPIWLATYIDHFIEEYNK